MVARVGGEPPGVNRHEILYKGLHIMYMPRVTICFGIVLVIVGFLGAYLASIEGAKAGTALIPAYFGAPLVILGVLGFTDKLRMHVMHAAVLIALIGFAVPGFMVFKTFLAEGPPARPLAFAMQGIMAVTCAGYVFLAIKSFLAARKARAASADA